MKLLEAILEENLETVIEILLNDPTCIDATGDDGVPLSHLAAATGNIAIIKYIVEYSRASMNTVDNNQRDILHYCAMSGNVEMARYLVEKVGMSPLVPDSNLITAYEIAHMEGHIDLEVYFEEICGTPLKNMYKNPVRTGMHPDPSIVRVGEDYYMVNSSFIYFPCIPISHSKDLIHWQVIGHAITDPKYAMLDDLEGGRGYWAPDISYYEGRFYITATYRLNDTGTVYRKQIVVSSDKPEGPYNKPAIIDEDGIDPSIFNDDDGRRYMLLNRGARIFELNKRATEQISQATLLYYGSQKRAPEGPHLLKKDGYYYLFLAEGGTGPGHRVTVSRSRTLMGNYEPCPYNPIMRQANPKATIQRCGHGKPVKTQNDEWYMVYLCGRTIGDGYSILGRETALDKITWTKDGWPIVNNLMGPSALAPKPNLPEFRFDEEVTDTFEKGLDKRWVFPRPPEEDGYVIREGKLILKGSKAPLSSVDARNILLRKQQHFAFEATTRFDYSVLSEHQDAGIIGYYDENTWVKFGVFVEHTGETYIRVVEHIGHEDVEVLAPRRIDISHNISATNGSITLRVETNDLVRSFSYSFDGFHFTSFGTLKNVYYLCDEGIRMGKRFTGAMIGMYAYGGEQPLMVPFELFKYSNE